MYSGYYDYSEPQLLRLQHNLLLIRNAAGGRPVMFFTIPRQSDLQRFNATGIPPLTRELTLFAEREGLQYADLLVYMHDRTADWNSYFHECDDHWNATGARVAYEHLSRGFPFYREITPDER